MRVIAHARTDFPTKFGVPRQSGRVEGLTARIVFLPEYRHPDALKGIDGYSHLWLLWHFSEAKVSDAFRPTVRPPRLGGNKTEGVFATRSPFRPNPIGLSSVRLLGVEETEREGRVLIVSGADLMDGTPILDVKPYLPFTDSHPDALGGYADTQKDYKLQVVFPNNLKNIISADKIDAIIECLADDPRPSYQEDGKNYGMQFGNYDIRFTVFNQTLT